MTDYHKWFPLVRSSATAKLSFLFRASGSCSHSVIWVWGLGWVWVVIQARVLVGREPLSLQFWNEWLLASLKPPGGKQRWDRERRETGQGWRWGRGRLSLLLLVHDLRKGSAVFWRPHLIKFKAPRKVSLLINVKSNWSGYCRVPSPRHIILANHGVKPSHPRSPCTQSQGMLGCIHCGGGILWAPWESCLLHSSQTLFSVNHFLEMLDNIK